MSALPPKADNSRIGIFYVDPSLALTPAQHMRAVWFEFEVVDGPVIAACARSISSTGSRHISKRLAARFLGSLLITGFPRECGNHSFSHQDEMCARACDPDALPANAGALEQQRQRVGEQIGFRNPGVEAELRKAVALFSLEFLDDESRRMIALGKLDRHIGHVAAAAVVADALGPNTNPGMELCERVAGMSLLDSTPDRVNLSSHGSQASDNKIILGAEVTIERHFVGVRGLCDRVDSDPPDPMFTKEIPGSADNALPRFPRNHAAIRHGFVLSAILVPQKKCCDCT
jgi:hypothetical protein